MRKELRIVKNGEALTITRSCLETNGEYTQFEGSDEPGVGPPLHVHFKQEEGLKVLEGRMGVEINGERIELKAGDEYVFAPGVAHRFWNAGNERLHYSGYVKPSLNYEYFIEQVYTSANKNRDDKPGVFDAAFLLTRYKSEFDMLVIPKPVKRIVFPILLFIGKLTGKFKKYRDAPPAL
ncbi:MAG: cupin domain-containing protein [Ferruginibacter sp.]|nr:cupin domain-containing protein [Chitinophagaceae bacterium]